jgi:hypothetical protein
MESNFASRELPGDPSNAAKHGSPSPSIRCRCNGKQARSEPVRLEIKNDRLSVNLVFAIAGIQTYRVCPYVPFYHIPECLHPGCDHIWGHWWSLSTHVYGRRKIQNLECRMLLERTKDGAPRFVVHNESTTAQTEFNKAQLLRLNSTWPLFSRRAFAIART